MTFYEICNLYPEHYTKYELIASLKASNFTYFGILHNKDYFPTGEVKKPHFHLILGVEGDSRKTKESIVNFFIDNFPKVADSIHIRNVRNPKGYCRYLTHKDNLEKQQYKDSEVFMKDKDRTLYEELISVQLKMSSTDIVLNKFKEFICYGSFDYFDKANSAFEFFQSLGKVDYFLKNKIRIIDYVDFVITSFNKEKEKKNGEK